MTTDCGSGTDADVCGERARAQARQALPRRAPGEGRETGPGRLRSGRLARSAGRRRRPLERPHPQRGQPRRRGQRRGAARLLRPPQGFDRSGRDQLPLCRRTPVDAASNCGSRTRCGTSPAATSSCSKTPKAEPSIGSPTRGSRTTRSRRCRRKSSRVLGWE